MFMLILDIEIDEVFSSSVKSIFERNTGVCVSREHVPYTVLPSVFEEVNLSRTDTSSAPSILLPRQRLTAVAMLFIEKASYDTR